ncbi:hypothetical protein D3C72_2183320 [compost metagenome]
MAFYVTAQFHPGFLFRHADIRVVAVAQHVDIEMLELAGGRDGLIGRAQASEHAFDVFVTDWHDQRGAMRRVDRLIAFDGGRNTVFVFADQ